MLVDSGATHNFAPARLVQALHLPVIARQPAEVTLPNGKKLVSNVACKIHVELRHGVVRKLTFAVVHVELLFILSMHWLWSNNVHIDFASRRMQLCNWYDKVQTKILAEHKQKKTAMHSTTLHSM